MDKKIRTAYGSFKGILDSFPQDKDIKSGPFIIDGTTVQLYDGLVDKLTNETGLDYSPYKINSTSQRQDIHVVRPKVSSLVTRLMEEYNLNSREKSNPGIVILNQNNNQAIIKTDYDINNLIELSKNDLEKEKLTELNTELSKDNKDWGKIKPLLVWIINFSRDLFLQVIPILLQKKA